MLKVSDDPQIPLYQRIINALGQAIRQGQYGPGDQLPTKAALASTLQVSQTTIDRSYGLLQSQGIIQQRRGSGTRVSLDALERLGQSQGSSRQFKTTIVVAGENGLVRQSRDQREILTDILAGMDEMLGSAAGRFVFVEALDRLSLRGHEQDIAILIFKKQHVDPLLLSELLQRGVPVVSVWSSQATPGVPHISYDPHQAARLACRHLIDCGYRRLGYIGVMGDAMLGAKFFEFTNTLYHTGLDFSVRHVREVGPIPGAAYEAARSIIASGDLPEAFFVDTDCKAMEVLHALRIAGLSVPDDIAVVGYDDMPEASRFSPALTSVRIPRQEIGRRAGQMIRQWSSPPQANEVVKVEATLMVRASTRLVKAGSAQADHLQLLPEKTG